MSQEHLGPHLCSVCRTVQVLTEDLKDMEEEEGPTGARAKAKVADARQRVTSTRTRRCIRSPGRGDSNVDEGVRGKAAHHRQRVQSDRISLGFRLNCMLMWQDTNAATILGVFTKVGASESNGVMKRGPRGDDPCPGGCA